MKLKRKPSGKLAAGIILSLAAVITPVLSGCGAAETVPVTETGAGNALSASRAVTIHQSRY